MTLSDASTLEQLDPLVAELVAGAGTPERVHYAAGVLLDAEDFGAEQRYGRGRLARALAALFGAGTIAGLAVACGDTPEREVTVAPGLALDRLGRLIEIRRPQCLRLARWLLALASEGEARRVVAIASARDGEGGRVLPLDVHLRFTSCPRGRTPAFAAGPFNATDYTVPARVADGFELLLDFAPAAPDSSLREPTNSVPPYDTALAELAALPEEDRSARRREMAVDAALAAWPLPDPADTSRLRPLSEHREPESWLNLLLARLAVPVTQTAPDALPVIDLARPVAVDNRLRPIVFNPHRWQGS